MTLIRPSGFKRVSACSSESSTAPNSSLTAIRMAWKLRFAGCPPVRRVAAGIAILTISANSVVVSIGRSARLSSIARAIRLANFSSP